MDPPAPEEARRSGRSPAARSRDRIAERADRLSGRRAVRRHRVPAVRVHADRAADRAVDYGPPRRAGAGRERGQEAHRGQSQASSVQARSAKLSGMNGAAKEPVPQLDALTGIRGIAAWFVVLFHMRLAMTLLLPPAGIAVLGKGYLADDLFFMLSGFVLWLNYGARFAQGGRAEAPRFWWMRFARVWPLLAAVLVGLALFAAVLLATGRDASHYPFAELPLHVLLVQNWGFTHALTWNDPAWSISTALGAYIVFPFVVLGMPWQRLRVEPLLACAALLCAALFVLFVAFGPAAFAAWLRALALARGPVARARGSRPLRALGDSSYATYLILYPQLT